VAGATGGGSRPGRQGREVPAESPAGKHGAGDLKSPRWSAARRAGPRHGPVVPSAEGTGLSARRATRCGVPHRRLAALRPPFGGKEKGRRANPAPRKQYGRRSVAFSRLFENPVDAANTTFHSLAIAINPRHGSRKFGQDTMDKFTTLDGVAAPLRMINVDTDMIIPKQYLKTIKRTGLGKGLFSEKRYRDDGSENPDFVLNKPAYRNSKILVAGDNFGCGSSREHAPWALMDFGIRCVISTSFGDIFYNNCFKNGVLPIKVSPEDLEKLFDDAERGANATLSIDLEKQEIRGPDGGVVKFDIDPHRKRCLLNGLDDIGLTMEKRDSIATFEEKARTARPWL
jgi:3-isopropylmalate/(R)-2-methylmalate dehydratase small subunit